MDFNQLITHRYSCRHYSSDPVPEELLDQILVAAQMAPTAANRQPFQIIIVKTENKQEDLLKIYNKEWFVQTPLILFACRARLPRLVPGNSAGVWSLRDDEQAVVPAVLVEPGLHFQVSPEHFGRPNIVYSLGKTV